jgi:hypothetical protein
MGDPASHLSRGLPTALLLIGVESSKVLHLRYVSSVIFDTSNEEWDFMGRKGGVSSKSRKVPEVNDEGSHYANKELNNDQERVGIRRQFKRLKEAPGLLYQKNTAPCEE